MVFPIAGGTQDTGYEISNSLRFNDNDTAYLNITRSSQSNTTGTFSVWTKMGNPGADNILFGGHTDVNNRSYIYFSDPDGYVGIFSRTSGSADIAYNSNGRFRDPTAWYHVVVAIDTTDGTAGNRFKMYINGTQYTDWGTSTAPSQNASLPILNQAAQTVGGGYGSSAVSAMAEGYMADAYYIDGQQLDASNFGETDDNGVWIPKRYLGTYGTNGFKLEFQQTGTGTASASTIGADTSGSDNHLTSNNLAATDVTTDTPTNNFAVINAVWSGLSARVAPTLSEGNTQVDHGSTDSGAWSTIIPANGKWYAEFKITNTSSNTSGIAIMDLTDGATSWRADAYQSSQGFQFFMNGNIGNDGTATTSYGSAWSNNDIIGIAMDLDNGKIYFSINGTYQNSGDPTSGSTGTGAAFSTDAGNLHVLGSAYKHSMQGQWNFGQPAFSISSGNADANGHGNFEYAPPSGYFALCTKNLAEFG